MSSPPPPPPVKVGELHLLSAQPPFALTDLAGLYLSKVLPRRPVPASAEWDTKRRLDSALAKPFPETSAVWSGWPGKPFMVVMEDLVPRRSICPLSYDKQRQRSAAA